MKYFSFLLVLSVLTAVVSFAVPPGMAVILRVFSAVLLVSFAIALLHMRRVKLANKPVPATFATSFQSEIEKP